MLKKIGKKTKSLAITALLLVLTPALIYFVSDLNNTFDSRSKANSESCTFDPIPDSTLTEYASKKDISIGTTLWECIRDENTQKDLCKEIIKKEFSGMTSAIQVSWRDIEKSQGVYDYTKFDQITEFAKENEIKLHFHHIFWSQPLIPQNSFHPAWLFPSTGTCGTWTKEQLLEIMKTRVHSLMEHNQETGGTVISWNVVNEAFDTQGNIETSCYTKIIGKDWIDIAFKYAREESPDAILVLNEAFTSDFTRTKVDGFFNYVKEAKARGVPIDAVGLQNHLTNRAGSHFEKTYMDNLKYYFKKANDIGVKVYITEMDVYQAGHTQEEVATIYKKTMTICLQNDNCDYFAIFGISDQYSWLRNQKVNLPDAKPVLFDEQYERKPAYTAVMEAIAENTTRGCKQTLTPKEIIYSTIGSTQLKMDICEPLNADDKNPAILFIHGGGFKNGDKSLGTDKFCQFFAENGYVFTSINYRLSPNDFPAAYDDVQYAVRWLRENADKYSIDPDKIVSMGTSAGATLASYLGVADTQNQSRGLSNYPSKTNLVISFFGAQDFNEALGSWKPFSYFHNNQEEIKKGSPLTHVTSDDAPFLMFHGTSDKTIPSSQSKLMIEKLKSLNIANKLVLFDGVHAIPTNKEADFKEEILAFLKTYLKSPKTPETTAIPTLNITIWDNFRNNKLNSQKWEAYENTPDVEISQTSENTLRFSIPGGSEKGEKKYGGIVSKTQIPSDSDFRVIASIYKPSISGEGEGATGISFTPSENEEKMVKVSWIISKNSSKLVLTAKLSDGKVTEYGKVDAQGSKLEIRLMRVGSEYIAKYKIAGDDDSQMITIGKVSDNNLNFAGQVRLFSNNQGTNNKFPKIITKIDSASISWFDKTLTEREVLYDNFSGLTISSTKWEINTSTDSSAKIQSLKYLLFNIPAGANNEKAKTASIASKVTVPEGKNFSSTAVILKPSTSGEGIGEAGLQFISTATKEKATLKWITGQKTNKLVFVVEDQDGKEISIESIDLATNIKEITCRIKRDEDGYMASYREGTDADSSFKNFVKKVPVKNSSNGQIKLFASNRGTDKKFPEVKALFDKVTLSYYK